MDEHGHRPNPEKAKAIQDAPALKNIHEIKSYLGMLQYNGRFLQNLSTVLEPLHRLLHKDVVWSWGGEQRNAFERTKQLLCSARVLAHFDCQLPVISFAMRLLMG